MNLSSNLLTINAQILKSKVNKQALYGVFISLNAIIVATVISGFAVSNEFSFESLWIAQKTNPVLWFLDAMPFLFAIWGQTVGTKMAYEVGALLVDQTEELRTRTSYLENKAAYEATHDSLTDLPNRVLFHDRVEQAVKVAVREKSMFAVLLLDLDRFKEINDTLGHFNGDLILKQIALRLMGVVRESDTLSRLGDDEYGVLLPVTKDKSDVYVVIKKIQNALIPPIAIEGITIEVQASIGAVLFPEHGNDADSLLQRADVAMYISKQESSGFAIYNSDMDKYSPYRLTLMGDLRQAIENDEINLCYQPKVQAIDNRVTEVEVLVRWQHKVHGLIFPEDFISIAERSGLIKQLSRYTTKNALQQAALWHKSGIVVGVAVNLSAKNLMDLDFPEILTGILASYEFDPEYITFEITETAIMADPKLALEILTRLSKMGIKISIDDFGTGYSSLSYLKKLPVKEIKIDKSFVMDMLENDNDFVIVHATIELAHNLGLKVVAEGVENEETYNKLKELGCDMIQGYYISKPLPSKEFQAWYNDSAIRQ